MKGQLEKRVFSFFFIATFVVVFALILISWQIIRYGIRESEQKEIAGYIAEINGNLDKFVNSRKDAIYQMIEQSDFKKAVVSQNNTALQSMLNLFPYGHTMSLFQVYDNASEIIYGDRFPLVERHVKWIFDSHNFQKQPYYPIVVGQEVYLLIIQQINEDASHSKTNLGYICYLELFKESHLPTSYEYRLNLFAVPNLLDFNNLPERYKQLSDQVKNAIYSAATENQSQKIFRFGIELGGGLIIKYDSFADPALYIFFPFTRNLNYFAYKGLFAFLLILIGLALLMITFAGTWFKGRIIAPVRDLSVKMQEIESNPTNLQIIEKKYSGILGNMIDTFNSMNSSLAKYSNSLISYKTITDNLDSSILWMDTDLNIIVCNPITAEIFEFESCDEVIGKNLNELINIDKSSIDESKEHSIFVPHFELNTGEGNKYIKFVFFSLKKIDHESEAKYVASIYDVTKETKETLAREKLEFELIKSNRLAELGRLVEGIVHNINSPLNSIVGYAQLLKREHPDNQDIVRILNAGINISDIVKKLLFKVKENSISMLRPLDISELVSLELDMCRHNIFFSQHVKLKKKLKPLQYKVYASHGDISNCVVNILNNAVHSMRNTKERVLTVETDENEEWTIISVKDSGEGILPEHLDKIFNPDFSTKADGVGFGLGLAISQSVVEKYKGKIEVISTVGKGSTFSIFLPHSKE